MRHLKSYKKFFEDGGTATANVANTSGMGDVVAAQPGNLPGTFGTDGSGDVGQVLKTNGKRKKGNPSEVSDLRDLKEVSIKKVKDI
jgi:hypothetical protein